MEADKFRVELRLRRRRAGESLSALHHDIRRLMALAHPTLQQEAREAIACDYFIDAMDDADFALKVRERAPPTLPVLLSNWKHGRRTQKGLGMNSRPALNQRCV